MKQYPKFISLLGGIIAFFSFALPWVGIYSGISRVIDGFHPMFVILIIFFELIGFGIYCMQSISRALGIITIVFGAFFFYCLYSVFVNVVSYFDHGSSIITYAFFMSLIIVGVSLMLNRQGNWHSFARTFVLIHAVVGLLCFLIVVFSSNLNLKIAESLNLQIKYGAFLAAIGFILSIVGVLETPYKLENEDTDTAE